MTSQVAEISVSILNVSLQVLNISSSRVCGWCCVWFAGYVAPCGRVWSVGWRSVHGAVCCWCVGVPWRWLVAWVSVNGFLRRTRSGQDDATDEKKRSRGPPNVDGGTDLPPLCVDGQGVLEFCDGDSCRPADGDQDDDAGDDDETAADDHHLGLRVVSVQAAGALGSDECDHEADEAEDEADDDQRSGGLQIPGQAHHRLIQLALHLSGTLHHTPHPQTVPDDLARHDVGSDEGGHSPHGDPTGHRGPDEAYEADDLTCHFLANPPHGEEASSAAGERSFSPFTSGSLSE